MENIINSNIKLINEICEEKALYGKDRKQFINVLKAVNKDIKLIRYNTIPKIFESINQYRIENLRSIIKKQIVQEVGGFDTPAWANVKLVDFGLGEKFSKVINDINQKIEKEASEADKKAIKKYLEDQKEKAEMFKDGIVDAEEKTSIIKAGIEKLINFFTRDNFWQLLKLGKDYIKYSGLTWIRQFKKLINSIKIFFKMLGLTNRIRRENFEKSGNISGLSDAEWGTMIETFMDGARYILNSKTKLAVSGFIGTIGIALGIKTIWPVVIGTYIIFPLIKFIISKIITPELYNSFFQLSEFNITIRDEENNLITVKIPPSDEDIIIRIPDEKEFVSMSDKELKNLASGDAFREEVTSREEINKTEREEVADRKTIELREHIKYIIKKLIKIN